MKTFRLSLALLLVLSSASSCSYTFERSAKVKIRSEPPGALIWRSEEHGWQKTGPAPIELEQAYQSTTAESVSSIGTIICWTLAVTAAGSGSIIYQAESEGVGIGLFSSAGLASLLALLLPVLFTDDSPSEARYVATLDGYDEKPFSITVPREGEVLVQLDPSWYQRYGVASQNALSQAEVVPKLIPALGDFDPRVRLAVVSIFEKLPKVDLRVHRALRDTAANDQNPEVRARAAAALRKMKFVDLATTETPPGERPVVAVFDVFDTSGSFKAALTRQLTSFLMTALVESGRFQVVPREQIRKLLKDEKTASYKPCHEESCQIELGRAVAARVSLSTQLIKVGSRCMVTATLYDLKTETAGKGVTVNCGCQDEDLLGAMAEVARKISGL